MHTIETISRPEEFPRPNAVAKLGYLLGGLIWIMSAMVVYVILPRFQHLSDDFGAELPVLSRQIFDSAPVLFPLLAIVAAAAVSLSRSKSARIFSLIGLPFVLFMGVLIAIVPALSLLISATAH